MPRTDYGGSVNDFVATPINSDLPTDSPDSGTVAVITQATITFQVYTAFTGGTHVTDLTDWSGAVITSVTPDTDGYIRFRGSNDGYNGSYWLDSGTGNRLRIDPADLASRVAGVSSVNGNTGAVTISLASLGGAPLASPAFTGTPTGITKAHVGLGSADNTSDVNKPISTATQTALDAKTSTTDVTGLLTGYAHDGEALHFVLQASDGTWPQRSTAGADTSTPVVWIGYTGLASGPSIGGTGMIADLDIYPQ